MLSYRASSCSDLSLSCGGQRIFVKGRSVVVDVFVLRNVTQPTDYDLASCLVEEHCNNQTDCDVIDMIMMEIESVICPDECYYISIPHEPCNVTVAASMIKPDDPDIQVEGETKGVVLKIDSVILDLVFLDKNGSALVLKDGETIDIVFDSEKPGENATRICSYYDVDSKLWSTYGCYPSTSTAATLTCTCNHTTSFAVLLQFSDNVITGTNLIVQTLLTRVLNAFSIGTLFLSVVIFVYFKLYHSDQVKVHISLAISLALAQTLMLFMDQTTRRTMCKAIAGLLHYLMTVYCVCMLQEGILLSRKASKTQKPPVKGWVLVLTAWGIPLVMVITLMFTMPDGYGSDTVCWLTVEGKTMWIFVAQICVVVTVSSVLLFSIMQTFVSLKANKKKSDSDKIKATVRAVLIMIPLLGLVWTFSILQAATQDIFMQYLFILLNALQGPVFFVFQCLLHHEVQKVICRSRNKVDDSSKWAMSTSSTAMTEKKSGKFDKEF
ncbi:adhesion G-protein coupled receptor D1-like [Diadema antillarum]|uniref:adhesion G-protein coupled receptor D1-like n=1 Tax=Diadema antillarum TaxID=105358 RepID=UPI003A855362